MQKVKNTRKVAKFVVAFTNNGYGHDTEESALDDATQLVTVSKYAEVGVYRLVKRVKPKVQPVEIETVTVSD